jgi:hypothetical protein
MRPGERLLRLGIWGRRQAQRPRLSNTGAYGYIDSVVVEDDTAKKFDGYRALIIKDKQRAELRSGRTGTSPECIGESRQQACV